MRQQTDPRALPTKPRILIVDDDDDIVTTVSLLLDDRYSVATASNGLEALERVAAERYDAILLDLMMPVMDGADLKRELDRRGIDAHIVLTSTAPELAERARELGIADWIAKPLDFDRLEHVIDHVACLA